jgi:hypothetical protein
MRVNLLCIYSSLNRIRRAPAKLAESRPRPIVLTKNNQLEQKTIWNKKKKRKKILVPFLLVVAVKVFSENNGQGIHAS